MGSELVLKSSDGKVASRKGDEMISVFKVVKHFAFQNFVKISDMGRKCRRFVATLRFSRVELRYRVDR